MAVQFPQIVPIANGLLRLDARIKLVALSDEVGRHEEHARIAKPAQPWKGDLPHRPVTIIKGQ